MGSVQGTFQKVQRDLERRRERAGTLTLGQAIQAWLSYVADVVAGRVQPHDNNTPRHWVGLFRVSET
jgi:hypothetical protein